VREREDAKLGLSWKKKGFSEKKERIIDGVREDMIAGAFNRVQLEAGNVEMVLRKGDRLVSANGKTEPDDITDALKAQTVTLLFERIITEQAASEKCARKPAPEQNVPSNEEQIVAAQEQPPQPEATPQQQQRPEAEQPLATAAVEAPEPSQTNVAEQLNTEDVATKADTQPTPLPAGPEQLQANDAIFIFTQQEGGTADETRIPSEAPADAECNNDTSTQAQVPTDTLVQAPVIAPTAADSMSNEVVVEAASEVPAAALVGAPEVVPTALSMSNEEMASEAPTFEAPAQVEGISQDEAIDDSVEASLFSKFEEEEPQEEVLMVVTRTEEAEISFMRDWRDGEVSRPPSPAAPPPAAAVEVLVTNPEVAQASVTESDHPNSTEMSFMDAWNREESASEVFLAPRRESVQLEDSLQATLSAPSVDSAGIADFFTFTSLQAALDLEVGAPSALSEVEQEVLVQEEVEQERLEQEAFEACFEQLVREEIGEGSAPELPPLPELLSQQLLSPTAAEAIPAIRIDVRGPQEAKEPPALIDAEALMTEALIAAFEQEEQALQSQKEEAIMEADQPQPTANGEGQDALPVRQDAADAQAEEVSRPAVPFKKLLEELEAPDAPVNVATNAEVAAVTGAAVEPTKQLSLLQLLEQKRTTSDQAQLEAIMMVFEQALSDGAHENLPPGIETPLMTASAHADVDAVTLLLKWRANPNVSDRKGVVPLHMAICTGTSAVADLLVRNGAEVNKPDRHGQTPLFFAPSVEMCNQLLEARADINVRNHKGQSALHLAAYAGYNDVVAWLIDRMRPSVVHAKDKHGRSAAYCASRDPNLEDTVRMMVAKGADTARPNRRGKLAAESWEIPSQPVARS